MLVLLCVSWEFVWIGRIRSRAFKGCLVATELGLFKLGNGVCLVNGGVGPGAGMMLPYDTVDHHIIHTYGRSPVQTQQVHSTCTLSDQEEEKSKNRAGVNKVFDRASF